MSDLNYHIANAVSKKDKYIEFDNVDFDLNVGEGRSLVKNSVRLLGDLKVLDNNGANLIMLLEFMHLFPVVKLLLQKALMLD